MKIPVVHQNLMVDPGWTLEAELPSCLMDTIHPIAADMSLCTLEMGHISERLDEQN